MLQIRKQSFRRWNNFSKIGKLTGREAKSQIQEVWLQNLGSLASAKYIPAKQYYMFIKWQLWLLNGMTQKLEQVSHNFDHYN